jgi:hypothetical protein
MSQELEQPRSDRGYREYFWFAATLVVLMVCTAINDTEHLAVADASFAASRTAGSH